MTTLTIVEPDIAHLDFEAPLDCEECKRRRAAVVMHQWCGCLNVVCLPCRNTAEEEAVLYLPGKGQCGECGLIIFAHRYRDVIVKETPL